MIRYGITCGAWSQAAKDVVQSGLHTLGKHEMSKTSLILVVEGII